MPQGQCTQTLCSQSFSKQKSMCLLLERSRSSRYYRLYYTSTTKGTIRRGKYFPNYYLPDLKAPREANMSQNNISDNMSPQNVVSHLFRMKTDKNLQEEPVQDEESSLSSISTFAKYNNNGLLFTPTCTTCFNENKYLSMSEKSAHPWKNVCFNSTGE
jgi:hypothetical protein